METAIGIDLGGTNIKGVLINKSGKIIHQAVQTTQPDKALLKESGSYWKQAVFQMVQELKSKSIVEVDAIGLAAPGLSNNTNTAIRVMPERLDGLENLVWSEYLNEKEVRVVNDAHAALIAEAKFGAGKGIKNIVMLTLGTGVGGGIFINGELYQGNNQMAGHIGHMTVDVDSENQGITGIPGSLENAIGGVTVQKRSFGRFSTTSALVEAYNNGDPFATYVWLNSVRKLALGLCSLCNILSPDLFILGGGITNAGEALFAPLNRFMEIYEWTGAGKRAPIEPAKFSDVAGAVGAAGLALDRYLLGK